MNIRNRALYFLAVCCLPVLGCTSAGQSTAASPGTAVVDEVPVKWLVVQGPPARLIDDVLYKNKRAVVLFSLKSCASCQQIKAWWQGRKAPAGWTFVAWEFPDEGSLSRNEKGYVGVFGLEKEGTVDDNHWHSLTVVYPIVSVIEDRDRPDQRFVDVVSAVFEHHEDCKQGLQLWLEEHPQGIRR